MLSYGRQFIDDDIKAVTDVLRSDFLTCGPAVETFEKALCDVTSAQYAVACSNGTTALHLACLAIDLQADEVVIVPSLTFLATANAPRYQGAQVVFCDVDPSTGLMNAETFSEAIERCHKHGLKPKAVFPVHIAGQLVDLSEIKGIADKHDIRVIADSCHAIGGYYKDSAVGACQFEDMSVFSFHPVKTIAMGEGGAITTNNKDYADKMRVLRSHGMVKTPENGPWSYEMAELGYNYRVSDINCTLGTSQLKKLKKFTEKRQALVDTYNDLLNGASPYIQTPVEMDYSKPGWHLYALRIDFSGLGRSRAELMNYLFEREIGTQVHYIPVHSQPYYTALYGDLSLPGAQTYYECSLSFPLFYQMEKEDVERVVETLLSFVHQ